jgi:hypothetical protein
MVDLYNIGVGLKTKRNELLLIGSGIDNDLENTNLNINNISTERKTLDYNVNKQGQLRSSLITNFH